MGSVANAQSRAAIELERLRRAQGEATSGWANFWANFRAGSRAARADAWEFRNAVDAAVRRQREGWGEQERELARLRDKLEDLSDEWERIALQDRVVKLELETNLQQAIDQSVLLEDRVRALQAAGGRSVRSAQEARRELEAANAQTAAIEELIAAHDRQAAANAARIDRETRETAAVAEMESRLDDVQQNRARTIEEIERAHRAALAAGRDEALAREEASQRIAAAYQQELQQVNQLISAVGELGDVSGSALERQRNLLADLNGQLNIAAANYQALFDQIRAGGQGIITAGELSEQMEAIILNERRALRYIDDQRNRARDADIERYEELNRRRVQ